MQRHDNTNNTNPNTDTTPPSGEILRPEVLEALHLSEALAERLASLGIDNQDPLEMASLRLVHQSVQRALEKGLFDVPLSKASRETYQGAAAMFETWCATRAEPIDPVALSPEGLTAVVATYLTWLATDIDDDPALGQEDGRRKRRTALKGTSIRVYSNALRWWAAQHGLKDPVPTDAVNDLVRARLRSEPTRQAAPISKDDLVRMLEVIRQGPVLQTTTAEGASTKSPSRVAPEHAEAWIAANTAAVLVQYCAALRISERLRIRDEWLTVADDRIVIRWPATKGRPDGRSVDLYGDPDSELCPVRAVLRWLEVADRLGIDRKGLLLPVVTSGQVRTDANRHRGADEFKRVAIAAGLADELDTERHYIGTHGLRRGRATSLASLGVDIEQVRRLLGHAKASTTLGYIDQADMPGPDWSEELGL